jgi:hypothetical protein
LKEYALIAKSEFFTSKEERTYKRLVAQLFGKKTIWKPKTIDEIRNVGLSLPMIKVTGSKAWMSKAGKQTLISLTNLFVKQQKYSNNLYFKDVYSAIKGKYQANLDNENRPANCSFFDDIITELDSLVDNVTFVGEVEGLVFEDFDYLEFDNAVLKIFDESMLKHKHEDNELDNLLRKKAVECLEGKLVFIATERGSKAVALDKYKHRAKLNLSILKVLICSHVKGGFSNTHIKLRSKNSFQYQDSFLVGWSSSGGLHTSESASPRRDFPLTTERLQQFNVEELFQKLTYLSNKVSKNELEQAIEKSLYWFSEAQSDGCLASSFLKLWSCLECFFTITTDEITERNAKGIASLFMYGDLNMQLADIDELQSYVSLKTTIKKYYKLRSGVAHRAEYQKINEHVTILLSYIVSSIILSASCLACRGYESLERLAYESERLDKIAHTSDK